MIFYTKNNLFFYKKYNIFYDIINSKNHIDEKFKDFFDKFKKNLYTKKNSLFIC